MEENKIVSYEIKQLEKLTNLIDLTDKLLQIDYRKLHIVHLDDHRLFRNGLKVCLIKKLPNINIEEFQYNEQALIFIDHCFKIGKKIDLIITDFNHSGPNGLFFAYEVRKLEIIYSIKTTIMLLTMLWKDVKLTEATNEGIFDIYFPKSVDVEQLIDFTKNSTLL